MTVSGGKGTAISAALRATLLMGTAALAVSSAPMPARAQSAAANVSYNIQAGKLSTALTRWAQASGIKLLAPAEVLQGRSTAGLSGSHTPQNALAVLLGGTGLVYTFTGSTVTISSPNAGGNAAATVEGAIALDTIDVSGGGTSGGFTPDTPYQTPGSTSHVSREQIDRVPPTSPGDVFVGTPGVLNGGNRVGTSLNPNIRGLQGMGRVNTTVDGALNSTTSYRGYAGTRDETYVDPDMIGGIDITKGPSDGVGTGGIGGNITMRTLAAQDIVKDGETWGVRIKGSLGSNTASPPHVDPPPSGAKVARDIDRPSFFNDDSWSGSMATATFQEHFEGVLAVSKRKQGNYFAGKNNAADGFIYPQGSAWIPGRNAVVRPGEEVYNTSEDTESLLAKGKLKWGDGQSFELGYMRYDSTAGEEDEALINGTGPYSVGQLNLSRTQLDSYTARYRYAPSDNPLVNLRANLWHTDLDHERGQAYPLGIRDHSMATTGGDISNRSIITTDIGALTLDGGTEFRQEHAEAPIETPAYTSRGPNGFRTLASGFGKASFEPTDWLEVSAGARFDYYEAEGEGVAAVFPDRSESRLSPNFGAVVTPFDGLQLFAQYKEGFRPPSLRELYWELYNLQVNPDLTGEVSKSWEFGFNVLRDDVLTAGDKVRFKASYFRNRYDDFIIVSDVPDSFGQQHFTNIDRANYHGFELSGSYDTGAFFAEGAFTKYLTAEYCTPQEGCVLPRIDAILANVTPPTYVPPEWSGSVTAGVRLFDEALTLGARAHFSSTRIGTDWPPALQSNPGLIGLNYTWPEFLVFDVFGSYKLSEDTLLSFSVENVTDQYYYGPLATTGMPSPGRTARVGFTHTFGGDGIPLVPELGPLGYASEGAPGDNWTGLYAGGHYGYASADVSGVTTTSNGGLAPDTEAANFSDNGRVGGVQLGYNYQFDNKLVLGIEGDFTLLGEKSGKTSTLVTELPALAAAGHLESETEYELDWMASLRGRLGYSFGRLMVYGTGGVGLLQQTGTRSQYAASQFNANPTSTQHHFSETQRETSLGWTAGAGFEFAFANNWSLKGEYSYSNYGEADLDFDEARAGVTRTFTTRQRCIGGNPNPPCPAGYTGTLVTTHPGSADNVTGRKAENEVDLHTFKLGLNYRF